MPDAGGIKAVIEKSKRLDAYDKELFTALFTHLDLEQKKLYHDLSDRINHELAAVKEKKQQDWDIVTALADEKDLEMFKNNGLFSVLNIDVNREQMKFKDIKRIEEGKNEYACGIAFLSCKYSQIYQYTDRRYTARVSTEEATYDAGYRLYLSDLLTKREERLERTAAQYGNEQPFIFSPMSRRAVYISIDLGEKPIQRSDEIMIDFNHKGNGLDHVLMTGKVLLWNAEITGKDDLPYPTENVRKNIVPLFDQKYEIYKFGINDGSEYIYVEDSESDIKRIGQDIYMGVLPHTEVGRLRYEKIRLHKVPDSCYGKTDFIFDNSCKKELDMKDRVRTGADIEYVVRRFSPEGVSYLGYETKLREHISIQVYDNRRKYHYPKNGHLRSSSLCYLIFEEDNSEFFEDRISYMISFMNYLYPEFQWVGVV